MAISVPSATISSLTSDHTCSFICSVATTRTSLYKCSSLSSLQLQFPLQLHRQRGIRNTTSLPLRRRSHLLPVVEAKQQTFANFDELIAKSDKPVLVDFYALWCGPCQLMVPILEQVSATLKDKIQVVKIDTEKYTSLADKYRIEALPTFILFKDGEPCDRFEGAMPAGKLVERVEAALAIKQ